MYLDYLVFIGIFGKKLRRVVSRLCITFRLSIATLLFITNFEEFVS